MKERVFGVSDVGRCRENNQDQLLIVPELELYAVADGMGGHAAGEVASQLAIESLARTMKPGEDGAPATPDEAAQQLEHAFHEGNRKICESVQTRGEWRGMGTTIVALLAVGEEAVIGHVGDSRAYLLRSGVLSRLTVDHSWVAEQVKLGLMTDAEAHRHPMRNIVTRALGNRTDLQVELTREKLIAGDVFMLCSDGLNSMLGDDEIRDTMATHAEDPEAASQALVDQANQRGGEDNITVVVFRFNPK
jgi:serine/threonine protein phosphatase PrpC